MAKRTCTHGGCDKPYLARGWCSKHYHRWLRTGRAEGQLSPDERFAERIMPAESCEIWVGNMNANGYGRISVGGKHVLAHRYAWERANGPVPDGMELDHLCRNHACVRLSHLEPVVHRVNVLRGEAHCAVVVRTGVCKRGHSYDEQNTHVGPDGKRYCRACRAMRARAYRKAARDA